MSRALEVWETIERLKEAVRVLDEDLDRVEAEADDNREVERHLGLARAQTLDIRDLIDAAIERLVCSS